jgi:hypothetical protein
MISLEEFDVLMKRRGWVIFPAFFDEGLVARLIADTLEAYKVCRSYQIKNAVDAETELTVHHLIGLGDSFLECLEGYEPLQPYLEHFFNGKFILNSFGGAINSAHSVSYAHRVHRDIRSFSGTLNLMMNTLVMLDAFTPDNGSTWLMSGSHLSARKPTDEEFVASAEQAIGPAGSVLMFNSNLWHAGGENKTDYSRRSLTPMFSRPFMKQQFDYPRALGYDQMPSLSEISRQLLGYYSRVPASLDEWYQPPEKRMHRPGQG